MYEQIIPQGNISITVECGDLPARTYDYNPNRGPFPFKWDRRCGDGQAAASGTYSVVLRACDIYDNCGSARGKVEIPFIALVPAASTPMPTLLPTQQNVWFQTPTPVPSLTPTVQPTLVFPVLPAIGGNEASGEAQENPQPLLPLAAAALGTSVLLAAASRREEKQALADEKRAAQEQASKEQQAAGQAEREASVAAQTVATVNVEAPAVAVSTLAALAGVVKESFDGIWNEAVRISPADAPTVRVTHTGIDMDEYNRNLAGWIAEIEYKKTPEYQRLVAANNPQQGKAGKVEAMLAQTEPSDYAEWSRLIASTGGKVLTGLSKEQFQEFVSQSPGAALAANTYIAAQLAAYEAAEKAKSEYSNQTKAFREGEAESNDYYEEFVQTTSAINQAILDNKLARDEEQFTIIDKQNPIDLGICWANDAINLNGNMVFINKNDLVNTQTEIFSKRGQYSGESTDIEAYVNLNAPTVKNTGFVILDILINSLAFEQYLEKNAHFRDLIYKIFNLSPDLESNIYYTHSFEGDIKSDFVKVYRINNIILQNKTFETIKTVTTQIKFDIIDSNNNVSRYETEVNVIPVSIDNSKVDLLNKPIEIQIPAESNVANASVEVKIYSENYWGIICHDIK